MIATIMEPVIKALDYFHRSGNIHRDIKAGNILIDDHGNVKLADYGVATSGFDSFNFGKNAHQTFVGTPCWCAADVRGATFRGLTPAAQDGARGDGAVQRLRPVGGHLVRSASICLSARACTAANCPTGHWASPSWSWPTATRRLPNTRP